MVPTITIGNQVVPLSGPAGFNSSDASSFAKNVIAFCLEWLSGKSSFVVTTSGSTGAPKEITLTRDQLETSARLTARALNLQAGMNALLCLDPTLIAGKMMLVRSFVSKMSVIAVEPAANPLVSLNAQTKIDFAAMVPYQVNAILKSGGASMNNIDTLIIGGGAVAPLMRHELQRLRTKCYATYGMTETVTHVALQSLNGPGSKDYFEALPDIHLSVDGRGCLTIQAAHLGSTPIVSNDIVEMVGPNKFNWLGRWDNVINTGGVKVIPENVERAMFRTFRALDINNRFMLCGTPHSAFGEQVTLIIEGELSNESLGRLESSLAASLDRYQRPRAVLFAKQFAETTNGKVDRTATARLASPRPD